MSASTRTAPAQLGLGGFPTAIIALALVVILAAAVAFAALNGTKVGSVGAGAQTAPFVDHGSRGELSIPVPAYIWHDSDDYTPAGPLDRGAESFGGWNGPRMVEGTRNGGDNGLRRPQ